MGTLEIGDAAPDFRLPGLRITDGLVERRYFQLSEMRGTPIVLAFYPFDSSPGCTTQLCEYEQEFDGFNALGADVWAVSLQDLNSHEKFARNRSLSFPLLADFHHGVAAAYGATFLNDLLIRRSVFIIDGEGVLRWKHVATTGYLGHRSAQELREKILEIFSSPAGARFELPAPEGPGTVAAFPAPISAA
ncbi:MAG: peroxiredoxin [Schumannella sp.]|jgi:peroxiredoxin Q/BCP|nr:peroxiredoxin [Schumannella sp.]